MKRYLKITAILIIFCFSIQNTIGLSPSIPNSYASSVSSTASEVEPSLNVPRLTANSPAALSELRSLVEEEVGFLRTEYNARNLKSRSELRGYQIEWSASQWNQDFLSMLASSNRMSVEEMREWVKRRGLEVVNNNSFNSWGDAPLELFPNDGSREDFIALNDEKANRVVIQSTPDHVLVTANLIFQENVLGQSDTKYWAARKHIQDGTYLTDSQISDDLSVFLQAFKDMSASRRGGAVTAVGLLLTQHPKFVASDVLIRVLEMLDDTHWTVCEAALVALLSLRKVIDEESLGRVRRMLHNRHKRVRLTAAKVYQVLSGIDNSGDIQKGPFTSENISDLSTLDISQDEAEALYRQGALWERIYVAYRRLAKIYHTDRIHETPDAGKFSEISLAHARLRNHFEKMYRAELRGTTSASQSHFAKSELRQSGSIDNTALEGAANIHMRAVEDILRNEHGFQSISFAPQEDGFYFNASIEAHSHFSPEEKRNDDVVLLFGPPAEGSPAGTVFFRLGEYAIADIGLKPLIPRPLDDQMLYVNNFMKQFMFTKTMLNYTLPFLAEMYRNREAIRNQTALDLGAGGGIASLFALRLGAQKVVAIERSEHYEKDFYSDLELNGFSKDRAIFLAHYFRNQKVPEILKTYGPFQVVLANIGPHETYHGANLQALELTKVLQNESGINEFTYIGGGFSYSFRSHEPGSVESKFAFKPSAELDFLRTHFGFNETPVYTFYRTHDYLQALDNFVVFTSFSAHIPSHRAELRKRGIPFKYETKKAANQELKARETRGWKNHARELTRGKHRDRALYNAAKRFDVELPASPLSLKYSTRASVRKEIRIRKEKGLSNHREALLYGGRRDRALARAAAQFNIKLPNGNSRAELPRAELRGTASASQSHFAKSELRSNPVDLTTALAKPATPPSSELRHRPKLSKPRSITLSENDDFYLYRMGLSKKVPEARIAPLSRHKRYGYGLARFSNVEIVVPESLVNAGDKARVTFEKANSDPDNLDLTVFFWPINNVTANNGKTAEAVRYLKIPGDGRVSIKRLVGQTRVRDIRILKSKGYDYDKLPAYIRAFTPAKLLRFVSMFEKKNVAVHWSWIHYSEEEVYDRIESLLKQNKEQESRLALREDLLPVSESARNTISSEDELIARADLLVRHGIPFIPRLYWVRVTRNSSLKTLENAVELQFVHFLLRQMGFQSDESRNRIIKASPHTFIQGVGISKMSVFRRSFAPHFGKEISEIPEGDVSKFMLIFDEPLWARKKKFEEFFETHFSDLPIQSALKKQQTALVDLYVRYLETRNIQEVIDQLSKWAASSENAQLLSDTLQFKKLLEAIQEERKNPRKIIYGGNLKRAGRHQITSAPYRRELSPPTFEIIRPMKKYRASDFNLLADFEPPLQVGDRLSIEFSGQPVNPDDEIFTVGLISEEQLTLVPASVSGAKIKGIEFSAPELDGLMIKRVIPGPQPDLHRAKPSTRSELRAVRISNPADSKSELPSAQSELRQVLKQFTINSRMHLASIDSIVSMASQVKEKTGIELFYVSPKSERFSLGSAHDMGLALQYWQIGKEITIYAQAPPDIHQFANLVLDELADALSALTFSEAPFIHQQVFIGLLNDRLDLLPLMRSGKSIQSAQIPYPKYLITNNTDTFMSNLTTAKTMLQPNAILFLNDGFLRMEGAYSESEMMNFLQLISTIWSRERSEFASQLRSAVKSLLRAELRSRVNDFKSLDAIAMKAESYQKLNTIASQTNQIQETVARSEMRKLEASALGLTSNVKINGTIGIAISPEAAYRPDNPDAFGPLLLALAKRSELRIAVVVPDGIGREVIYGINAQLPENRRIIAAKDWQTARSELRRLKVGTIKGVIADTEGAETEALLLRQGYVDEVVRVKPGSVMGFAVAAGLQNMMETYRSELRLALAA